MKEKKVYILFTNTSSFLSKLIQIYTKNTLNHVSLSFDQQLKEIYSFGRKKSYNPFIGGFVREKIAAGLFKRARCEVYSYSISESDYEQMLTKGRQFESEKDLYRYNLLGLFAIILNYKLKRENAFFCSQFVATILNEKKGVLDKTPSLCTPKDLMEVDQLQLIYKGLLNSYPYQDIEETMEHELEVVRNPISTRYKSPDFTQSPCA
jgi:hypothetical protein